MAKILGYERATKAILDHVDEEDLDAVPIQDSIGRMQNTPIVNKSGLYSLIISSKLPNAGSLLEHTERQQILDLLPFV